MHHPSLFQQLPSVFFPNCCRESRWSVLQDKREALGQRIISDYFTFANLTMLSRMHGPSSKLKPVSFTRKKSRFDRDSSPDCSSLGMGRNCVIPTRSTKAFVGSSSLALNRHQPLQDHDLQLSIIYPEGSPSRHDSDLSRNSFLSGCL